MQRTITLIIATITTAIAFCAEPTRHSFSYSDTTRTYTMIMPDSLSPYRPLVICAHGYGSRNRNYNDLNTAAAQYGFAVCYPDGAPDSRGKDGWNVGYPSQQTMTIDETNFFDALLTEVCDKFNLNRNNAFLSGMSNGGDLCYHIAYTRPELFKAYASVAGLTFTWMYMQNRLTKPVPFIEIHGTADKTSMWEGDPTNSGGWGEYLPVPLAVAAIAYNNRCTATTTNPIQAQPGSEKRVMRHDYTGSPYSADVVLIEIEGGKHSWANKDIPTGQIICEFLSQYLD